MTRQTLSDTALVQVTVAAVEFERLHGHCAQPLQVDRDGGEHDEAVRAVRITLEDDACCAHIDGLGPCEHQCLQQHTTARRLAGGPGGLDSEAGAGALGEPAMDVLHLLGGPLGGSRSVWVAERVRAVMSVHFSLRRMTR